MSMAGILGVGLLELVGDDVERGTFKVLRSPTGSHPRRRDGGFSMPMSPLFPVLHLKHKGPETKGMKGTNLGYECKSQSLG